MNGFRWLPGCRGPGARTHPTHARCAVDSEAHNPVQRIVGVGDDIAAGCASDGARDRLELIGPHRRRRCYRVRGDVPALSTLELRDPEEHLVPINSNARNSSDPRLSLELENARVSVTPPLELINSQRECQSGRPLRQT